MQDLRNFRREEIDKYKEIALSDDDVRKLLDGKCKIVLYRDMHKYINIDEILSPYGMCIILYEFIPHKGHWVLISVVEDAESPTGKSLEWFDPYSKLIDHWLTKIEPQFAKESNQDHTYLANLIYKTWEGPISVNEFKFQKLDKRVQDCGRHCVCRAVLRDLTLYQYQKLMCEIYKDDGLDADDIVTAATMLPSQIKT